jgi:hypothetical protein
MRSTSSEVPWPTSASQMSPVPGSTENRHALRSPVAQIGPRPGVEPANGLPRGEQ